MSYKGKKIAITGVQGFIGNALFNHPAMNDDPDNDFGPGIVHSFNGDIRDPATFQMLDYSFDYLFHFGAPSSQILFKRDPQYCIETTLKGFMNAADACRRHGVKLIYPSTGLLSMGEINEYARCKKLCEDYAQNQDSIGFRIFATYGPGEGHKRDYASVPYLFANDMLAGKPPVVFGTGEQQRDFIYIDDVVDGILTMAEEANEKVIDLGSGESMDFKTLVDSLTEIIKPKLKPRYIEAPTGYVDFTKADISVMLKYMKPKYRFMAGLEQMVKNMEAIS